MTAGQPGLDPTRTALLVMDFQAGGLPRLPGHQALLECANTAIDEVRTRNGHVGWVRMGFEDADFEAIPPSSVMAGMLSPDRRPGLHAAAPASQIHSGLSPQSHDISVRKTRVGAFTTTDLDRQLRDRQIATIVLAGISTSGVVLSTVREATDRDYRIVVLNDACADHDPDTHTFLMSKIFARYATVVNVEELPSLLV